MTDVIVLMERIHFSGQTNGARIVSCDRKRFVDHRDNFAAQETDLLSSNRPVEALKRKLICLLARNPVLLSQILGAATHGHIWAGIEQSFPKKVFEFHLSH